MTTYDVTYAARKHGSIGKFYPTTVRVTAHNDKEAREEAFRRLHEDGYETNQPMGEKIVND